MQGRFFWYDLMTSDIAAAAKFYGDVVGWQTQGSGSPGYTLFATHGMGMAGLMTVPEDAARMGARPAWMGYIHVEDVDAMARDIVAADGHLHKGPVTVEGVIRWAVVSDPQGGAFMIATPLPTDTPPRPAPGTPGTFGWHELYADEWQAAFAFYEKLFGWTRGDNFDMGPMGSYQLFLAGGSEPIGGMMTKPPMIPRPFWGYYINVPSVTAAIGKIEAGGGKVVHGPTEVPGGQWIVQAVDPQGAHFALVSAGK